MENLSFEELSAILGEEAAKEIIAQRDSNASSGGKIPFTFLNKIADVLGSDLGGFGEFVVGVEKGKDDAGNPIIINNGVNLGKSFEFLNVTSCFYYKKFVPSTVKGQAGKVYSSNILRTLSDIENAVDALGNPLPKTKDEKKAANWKLVRLNAGLVRASSKDKFIPCIWEVDGTMLFGYNEVNKTGGNIKNENLKGILSITSGMDKTGSVPYVTIDLKKSKFEKFTDVKVIAENADAIKEVTLKMKEFVDARAGVAPSAKPTAPVAPQEETLTEEAGW